MTSDELQRVRRLMSEGSTEQCHPKAFISHATADHPFVETFAADLRANGVDAWFSKWEIKPGDSIRAKIEEGLEGCEVFIVVLSTNSINRPWVQIELDAATIRKLNGKVRKIIPVKIEDCGGLPPTLAALLWEDFSIQLYESALNRVLDSIFEVDVRPPLGKRPAPTPLVGLPPKDLRPEQTQKRHPTNFPIHTGSLGRFADQLWREGFDASTDLFNGQVGLIVGPKGLDERRLPPEMAGLFFPLWEVNYQENRPYVEARRFHDIFENRPKDWTFNRPYQRSTAQMNTAQRAECSGYIVSVKHDGRSWTYEVRDPQNPEQFARADIYSSKEDAKSGAIEAVRKRCAMDNRTPSPDPIEWEDFD